LGTAYSAVANVKIGARNKIDSSAYLYQPLTFTLYHECKDMIATPTITPEVITYTLGTGSIVKNLNTAFTYTTGCYDYCFTY